jgi:nucleotide-binding universal stress UspA family protein
MLPVLEDLMYRSILLPLDGSSFADEALPMAAHLASVNGAHLTLAHVIRPAPDVMFKMPDEDLTWKTQVRVAATDALGEEVLKLKAAGVDATAEVREGPIVDALMEVAEAQKADLVVLTTHGAGGFRRWWLGSVADALVRRGDLPVLLVRPWDDTEALPSERGRFGTVLVPLDGSPASEKVLEHAKGLKDQGARLILVRVVPSPLEVGSLYGIRTVRLERESHRAQREEAEAYLQKVASRLGVGDDEVRVVEATSAAEGILEAARIHGADLIALSTQGRSALGRMVIGSVADKVIRGAAIPVLAIRPQAH